MAQKTINVEYVGYENVSRKTDGNYIEWNGFYKVKLPPFMKLISCVVNPNQTSFNPSNQWYGIFNTVNQGQGVIQETSDLLWLYAPVFEKDGQFYGTMSEFDNLENGDFFECKEGAMKLLCIGMQENTNALLCLRPNSVVGSDSIPLFFGIDGEASSDYIYVVPDSYELVAGTIYIDYDTSAELDDIVPCKITGVDVDTETLGCYCTNTEGVDAFTCTIDGDPRVIIRVGELGKLNWKVNVPSV